MLAALFILESQRLGPSAFFFRRGFDRSCESQCDACGRTCDQRHHFLHSGQDI